MYRLHYLFLAGLALAHECPSLYVEKGTECVHKDLLPLSWMEAGGMVIIFLAAILANATGIGGGGIFVPVLILIMRFSASEAIPMSKALILGGAISTVVINWNKVHPFSNVPLIDFPVVALLHPMLMLGTIIGVIANRAFPEWLIITLLVLTLAVVTKKTFEK